MTPKELNRDIKRLAAEIYRMSFESNGDYFKYIEREAKEEFTRLFYADQAFEYMSHASMKIMLRLNVKHRYIQFHQFGLLIEINELI